MARILVLFCIITPLAIYSQTPLVNSSRTLGGSNWDMVRGAAKTSDGGYILACHTESSDGQITGHQGFSDGWIIKFSAAGTIEWSKCIGKDQNDWANDIIETPDSGYLVLGTTYSEFPGEDVDKHDGHDVWLVKLSTNGDVLWQKCFGGDGTDAGTAIYPTLDGGYIIAANTFSSDGYVTVSYGEQDAWIIKLNRSFALEWQKSLGGSLRDIINSIVVLPDSTYLVGGATFSNDSNVTGNHGRSDVWVVRLAANGALILQKCFGGTDDDFLASMRPASDGGIVFTGFTESRDGDVQDNDTTGSDVWVVKLDGFGQSIVWQRCFGGTSDEQANCLTVCSNGDYLIGGNAFSHDGQVVGNHGATDGWLLRLSPTGDLKWQMCLGGSARDNILDVLELKHNEYIIGGWTFSTDGDILNYYGGRDGWLVKLFDTQSDVDLRTAQSKSLHVYPNPARSHISIFYDHLQPATIMIHTISGAHVRTVQFPMTLPLDLSDLPSGAYFVTVAADGRTETTTLQLVR